MTAIFGALTTGLGLTEDIAAGAVDRFRSLPIARSAVLIGRSAQRRTDPQDAQQGRRHGRRQEDRKPYRLPAGSGHDRQHQGGDEQQGAQNVLKESGHGAVR